MFNDEIIDGYIAWLGVGHTPATVSSYYDALRAFRKWARDDKPIQDMLLEDVMRYIITLTSNKRTTSTIFHYITALRSLFGWLYKQGRSKLDPDLIPRPIAEKVRRDSLDKEEYDRIIASFKPIYPKDVRDRAIVAFLYATGLRLGEMLQIKIKDMDIEKRVVNVKTFKRRNHRRDVYWGNEAHGFILDYLKMRQMILDSKGIYQEALFISLESNGTGKAMQRCAVQRVFRAARIRAGISKKITPHSCRHGFASEGVKKGVKPFYLQEMLGHASLKHTMVYVHIHKEDVENEYRKIYGAWKEFTIMLGCWCMKKIKRRSSVGKPIKEKQIRKALHYRQMGLNDSEIAKLLLVNKSQVVRWNRYLLNGGGEKQKLSTKTVDIM